MLDIYISCVSSKEKKLYKKINKLKINILHFKVFWNKNECKIILKKHCLPMYKGLGSQLTESTAVVADTQISPSQLHCLGFPSQCLPPWMARKNMRPRSLLSKMASKSPLKTSSVNSAQLEVSCRTKIQFIYFS